MNSSEEIINESVDDLEDEGKDVLESLKNKSPRRTKKNPFKL